MIEFEQLRQIEEMSMDEYTNKSIELLHYVGQAYDTE